MTEEAQQMEAGKSDAVMVVQQAALIALNDLGTAVANSRVLCETLLEQAFLTAYDSARELSACGWPRDWVRVRDSPCLQYQWWRLSSLNSSVCHFAQQVYRGQSGGGDIDSCF